MSRTTVAIALAAWAGIALPSARQTAPQTPPTFESTVINTWKSLHNKILTMAKDFPETSTAGSRTRTHARWWTNSAT